MAAPEGKFGRPKEDRKTMVVDTVGWVDTDSHSIHLYDIFIYLDLVGLMFYGRCRLNIPKTWIVWDWYNSNCK